jgi:hypothetical protein
MPAMAESSVPAESAYGLEFLGQDLLDAEVAAALAPAEPVAAAASLGVAETVVEVLAGLVLL